MPETTAKFNRRFTRVFGALAAGLFLSSSAQAASGLSCPGFQGKARLTQVELSDGAPSENAWLAPDVSIQGKDGMTSRWLLARPNPRGYWARCHYGRVVLDLKLPMGLRQCTIRYDQAERVAPDGLQPSCR